MIAGANAESIVSSPSFKSKVAVVLTVPTLDKVTVDLMVVLGTTTMPIHQVLRLSRGAIIELDATEADEVKVLANNLPVASGVVLVDRNRIAVEVKQMLPRTTGSR
jgi:flagellar motor switch protein FliN